MAKEFFYKYICLDGERWDIVAFKCYGDTSLMPMLIADNPHVPTMENLEAGEILFIRKDYTNTNTLKNDFLPPWRSND